MFIVMLATFLNALILFSAQESRNAIARVYELVLGVFNTGTIGSHIGYHDDQASNPADSWSPIEFIFRVQDF